MRRTGGDMQVNVAGLRRNLKNLAHNYSDSQRKVREATSNDPWGPSSTLMAEIADLTYNVVAFTEIMQMVWKRLNDHGRNWRHVYKALVLLEYLIKTGSEKVGQQCKENIFAIQTLKDFQYLEEGKDQGQNVREKAKQLVILLKDDERLRNERARALKAKERFAQSACGFGSDGGMDTPTSPKYPAFSGGNNEWSSSRDSDEVAVELPRDLEVARPQTAGEEELQLQLALAMSREEAEQEEQKRRSDDVRLQLALSQSQQDFKIAPEKPAGSAILDLLDVNLDDTSGGGGKVVDPWGMPQPPKPQQNAASPWHGGGSVSPPTHMPPPDPWVPVSGGVVPPTLVQAWNRPLANMSHMTPTPLLETAIRNDPWSPVSHSSSDLDDFDAITNRNRSPNTTTNGTTSNGNNNSVPDLFELNLLGDALPSSGPSLSTGATKKTPHSFLGENSALVNLDNLVTSESLSKPASQVNAANPFSDPNNQQTRPVFNPQPPKPPTMNQIKQAPFMASPQMGSTPPSYQTTMGGYAPPSNVFTNNGQFSNSSPSSNGAMGGSPAQDPWAPTPQTNNTSQLGAPWMKPGYTF